MRNPTIWESASRPLFVRSVWLETANARRGHQRHFILDYEPRQQQHNQHQQQRQLKSALGSETRRRESFQHSSSCDFTDSDGTSEDLFLIGSAKVKLHQQPTPQELKQQHKLTKSQRRPSFLSQKHQSCETYNHKRNHDLQELYSRRSSLQDIQSTLSNACSNPDERLAERVLNWLDLAGKTSFLKTPEETLAMESNQRKNSVKTKRLTAVHTTNTTNNMQSSQRHYHQPQRATTAHPQRSTSNRKHFHTHTQQRRNNSNHSSAATHNHPHHHPPDSVKHVTIIFNKEGVPVRLNRPARNIDLCTLSSSAGTTRRLAGPLASARLYNSSDYALNKSTVLGCTRRHLDGMDDTSATTTNPKYSLHKRLSDEIACSSLHDPKKQLHIFMPSLPKKGLLATGSSLGTGVDDAVSVLSNTFSELCKI